MFKGTGTIEWGNSIRQIQWDLFDKLQDRSKS